MDTNHIPPITSLAYMWVNSPEVLSTFCYFMLQFLVQTRGKALKVSTLQCTPQLTIRVGIKGVKVQPQSAREQDRVLHKDLVLD